MIDFTKSFETNNLLLRPMKEEDYFGFQKINRPKDLWTYFTNDLSDDDELKKWVEKGVEDLKHGNRLALTILEMETKTIIGSTSIGNISERDKRVEIGWTWLGRRYQGKGFNDQTKYLLLSYCFEELLCERVEFKTDVLNGPARNALKRIGVIEEGVLRSHTLMTHSRRRDTIYYSVLRGEWQSLKANK